MSGPGDFRIRPHTRSRGSAAEETGIAWLVARGYREVGRNVRTEAGELDLVAMDGDTLCFVEIKARDGAGYGPAIAAVTRRKQSRIARAAQLYLVRHPWSGPCRFDVLGMDAAGDRWAYTLIQDAFPLANAPTR